MEQPWKGVKSINGLLWIILGLLIFIWLIYPTEIIESLLWLGFGIGCILVGLIQFKDLKLLLD